MGRDIHMVLQKKDPKTNKWDTVLKDVFSKRDHAFFGLLIGVPWSPVDGVSIQGYPTDFELDENEEHEGFWMGEHSYNYMTLRQFCDLDIPQEPDKLSFHVDQQGNKVDVEVEIRDDEDLDEYASVRAYQITFRSMFYDLENYRLVYGFDS